MDFELNEEQRMIQDMAYKFAVNEMAPVAQDYDREEKFGRDIWKKACEAGLVGPTIPEADGGPGFGFLEQAIITEQLSRVDLGLCFFKPTNHLVQKRCFTHTAVGIQQDILRILSIID